MMLTRGQGLRSKGMDLKGIAACVSKLMGMKVDDVWAEGKHHIVNARSLFCFWAVRELGVSIANFGRRLGLSLPAINKSVVQGKQIAESNGFKLIGS